MAFIDRDIDGLTHGAAGMVDVRGDIGELYEVLEILDGAVASAVIQIADEWWSIDWCENHVVATDRDIAFGVTRMLYVCCRRCPQKRANKSFRKPHPITIDVGTSFTPHGLDFLVIFEILELTSFLTILLEFLYTDMEVWYKFSDEVSETSKRI